MSKSGFWSLVTLAILLVAAVPAAKAAPTTPPPGPYALTCHDANMDGTTLRATCTDFFGNAHATSLDNVPTCVDDKHSIVNVTGTLRCVIWSGENRGFVSLPVDTSDAQGETKVWRIDQPVVNDPNPFGYDMVAFKPGDMVSISAGGCVQTGGSGKTWKSYTVPTGDNADHLYSGTVAIAGVIGTQVRIGGVLAPKEWIVPADLPPTIASGLHLVVGYQDDDYGDNGYYAHDNGNNDQCLNVGPAWIQVQIVSGVPSANQPQMTPFSKPFDLTWNNEGGVDSNGLPLNPQWGGQVEHPTTIPSFSNSCSSALSFDSWPGTGTNIDFNTLQANCTTQMPTTDLSTNSFDMFFGICHTSDALMPGHLDWAVVTYQGFLFWSEYSGDAPNDGDYNFNLFTDNNAGVAGNEDGLGLEFKGGETINNFGNPWWNNIVGSQNDDTIEKAINGHTAMVTGLMGIDMVHNGGYAESHPVFAMAIKLSETDGKDAVDENWVYFLRNQGNGGGCSSLTHNWPGVGGAYFVSFPWPAASVTGVQFDQSQFWKDESKAVESGHGLYPGWSFIKFQFPDDNTEVDGVVTLHYTLAPGSGQGGQGFKRPPTPKDIHDNDEPDFKAIAARLTDPALRAQFVDDLTKANPPEKTAPPKRVAVVIDNAVTEHNPPREAGRKGQLTRDKRSENPERTATAAATKPLVEKYQKVFPRPEVIKPEVSK